MQEKFSRFFTKFAPRVLHPRFFVPPPLGEVPQCAYWGGEGVVRPKGPLSLASLDSSPKGEAKAFVKKQDPTRKSSAWGLVIWMEAYFMYW